MTRGLHDPRFPNTRAVRVEPAARQVDEVLATSRTDEEIAAAARLREVNSVESDSQTLMKCLTSEFDVLLPLMELHLDEQRNELLPYLLMADIARWAQATMASDPHVVGAVVDWLEREFDAAAPAEQDLIGLGFVETIPFPPEGAPLLLRLGPSLTRVAREIGILPDGDLT